MARKYTGNSIKPIRSHIETVAHVTYSMGGARKCNDLGEKAKKKSSIFTGKALVQ
jgi:hypothetical protein